MKFCLALAVLAAFCLNAVAETKIGDFAVYEGLLCQVPDPKKPDALRLTKVKETTTIPYTTTGDDPHFGWGFVLQRRDGVEYTVRSHVTFPVPEGSKDAPKEVDTPEKHSAHGVSQTVFTIDAGDPSGVYKVQVFVDDQHVTDLEFTIEPKK